MSMTVAADDYHLRSERGELQLDADIEECRFCGANRSHLHYESEQLSVNQYDHHGRVAYMVWCDECDGAFVVERHEQTRVNLARGGAKVAEWWSIPEGWVMSVCDGCGKVAGMHRDDENNYPMFRAMRDGNITSCDTSGSLKVDEYVVMGERY